MNLPPALLLSVHDVSPLTLKRSQQAVTWLTARGVPLSALTLLVIPYHEERARLDRHESTCQWLREVSAAGATLVMHGLTHRMAPTTLRPWLWPLAFGFARGQGELLAVSEAAARRRLDDGAEILASAGLHQALWGFVPPAWLLSTGAARAVQDAGFTCYERFGGLHVGGARFAERVIGFGSLSAWEAGVTALYARQQAAGRRQDTRLAIHPVDMTRTTTLRAVGDVMDQLCDAHKFMNYRDFVAARA